MPNKASKAIHPPPSTDSKFIPPKILYQLLAFSSLKQTNARSFWFQIVVQTGLISGKEKVLIKPIVLRSSGLLSYVLRDRTVTRRLYRRSVSGSDLIFYDRKKDRARKASVK